MHTLRDSISQVRTLFKLVSFDDTISDRTIARILKSTALTFIKQQVDKRKLFSSPNLFTYLECIPMEQVPLSECCDYTSPCTISRSKYKIPKIPENIYGLLIQGVWGLDKKVKFIETTPNRYSNILRLNLKKDKKMYWIMNGYIYVSDPNIESISLAAYFEEDFDIYQYECDSCRKIECPDNPLDREFKCPSHLISAVEKEVYNIILSTYKRSIPDITSDLKDDAR